MAIMFSLPKQICIFPQKEPILSRLKQMPQYVYACFLGEINSNMQTKAGPRSIFIASSPAVTGSVLCEDSHYFWDSE